MKVLIFPTREAAEKKVSEEIINTIRSRPDCNLGLATGGTMEPVYVKLREHCEAVDCSKLKTFNLDEYVGLSQTHPQSYYEYMAKHIFRYLNIDNANVHIPLGDAPNPEAEAKRYEALIAENGGIDLQLLGIGSNGHIGFNEPCSSLGSETRIKTLTKATRDANARFFGPDEDVPRYAITMGIKTILNANEILVLATGSGKAQACQQMIEGPISARWPASSLQLHPRVTVVLDEDAASQLELREYFEAVHPAGQEAKVA
ncbi:glucosamine-6-phosphate deaminase [Ahrensia sp. 13_GOM-1096m]|uniref:glucosamine-6-phosphate deaminase n=1 Tax=Ahrensia sp. 13_GOM-1096m TaxID=1380380 RepID=UPI000478864F|nr:glucosamine-6-phosphate deaminase [Ahrensia sp. 13_GOM-1096m]